MVEQITHTRQEHATIFASVWCKQNKKGLRVLILGIETSCDETGIALFNHTTQTLLAHKLYSQIDLHALYGGVVPELASRDHIRIIIPLLKSLYAEANCQIRDTNLIAYTQGPGLAGALLVGTSIAKGLAWGLNIPTMGIHHLEGHILTSFFTKPAPSCPCIALLVSGAHTELIWVKDIGTYEVLGETRDDAAGEAFDKAAKLLNLNYPGGPALEKLARDGDPMPPVLPRPMIHSPDLDFSFSGLKTALLHQSKKIRTPLGKATLAREFQEAIVDVLCAKTIAALEKIGLNTVIVGGGVSANHHLRVQLTQRCAAMGARVYFPPKSLCTDNGIMIAHAASLKLAHHYPLMKEPYNYRIKIYPRAPIGTLPIE